MYPPCLVHPILKILDTPLLILSWLIFLFVSVLISTGRVRKCDNLIFWLLGWQVVLLFCVAGARWVWSCSQRLWTPGLSVALCKTTQLVPSKKISSALESFSSVFKLISDKLKLHNTLMPYLTACAPPPLILENYGQRFKTLTHVIYNVNEKKKEKKPTARVCFVYVPPWV